MSRHEGEFERFERAGRTVILCCDPEAESPRDNDGCLAVMACWHRSVNLGDRQIEGTSKERLIEELEAEGDKVLAIVPIWIYQHSGIFLHAQAEKPGYPYNCPWDSGQVGWAYVLKSTAEKLGCVGAYGGAEGGDWTDRYEHNITQEVEVYDRWQRGEFAGYIVEDDDEEQLDSCFGFDDVDYCRTEAREAATRHASRQKRAAKGKNRKRSKVK